MPTDTQKIETRCQHCWHMLTGPIFMALKDGEIPQRCCKCDARRVVHQDHAHAD